jgi:dihydropteroate synthase
MSTLRSLLRDCYILLGTSCKSFIGMISNETNLEVHDFGTVAPCVAALCLGDSHGCSILCIHNVKGMKQAAIVMDTIEDAK